MADEKIATDSAKSKYITRGSWCQAKLRCYDPENHSYYRYGGRGILMCERWRDSYEAYASDVYAELGPKPSPRHTIDRIDNDGHYEPGNIRWATPKQQSRNRSMNVLYDYNGKCACLYEHAEDAGLDPDLVYNRVRYRHMPLARAIAMGPRQKW